MKKLIYIAAAIIVIAGLFAISHINAKEKTMTNNNVLVAYFSATGNTRGVAERLATATGADLFEIQPETLYTDDDLNWRNDKSRSSIEMGNKDSRPVIANTIDDISKYDTIFLGFPIWWGREPSIVDTFVTSYDFAGKKIIPFATSGSTPSTAEAAENMRSLAPNVSIPNGARFPVDVTADELKTWTNEWL